MREIVGGDSWVVVRQFREMVGRQCTGQSDVASRGRGCPAGRVREGRVRAAAPFSRGSPDVTVALFNYSHAYKRAVRPGQSAYAQRSIRKPAKLNASALAQTHKYTCAIRMLRSVVQKLGHMLMHEIHEREGPYKFILGSILCFVSDRPPTGDAITWTTAARCGLCGYESTSIRRYTWIL